MSKNINDLELNLITDSSISEVEQDSLDFKVYSEVITEAILETPTPFTVGIFGEWGQGKTSLMQFIQKEVLIQKKEEEKVISVFFNAWKFENDDHPLLDLCTAIEKDIQRNRHHFEENIILNILDYVKYLKYAIGNIKLELKIYEHKNTNIEEIIENQLLSQSTYFQIFELLKGLEKILEEENFRIIIFIDDLDKCTQENAIKLLENINFVLDLKGLSFVLGVDRKIIENYLENRYINKFNLSNKNTGKMYLDKMIQLPFYLPSYTGKIPNLIDNLYSKDNNRNIVLENDIKNVILSISSLEVVTPRFIVRLINRIKVSSKIYMKLNPNSLLSKENILSLFSISCTLEDLYKELYSTLVKNDAVVEYIIKIIQKETFINEDTNIHLNINKTKRDLILKVVEENYNALRMILNTEQGKFWLENRAYRLDAFEYLKSNTKDSNENLPIYKTDFEDSIVLVEEKEFNEKEFIQIPGQDFEMSRYVVTNKWFNEFINANAYREAKYWPEIASRIWLMNNRISTLDEKYELMLEKEANYYEKKYKQPLLKENFNKDLQPVVYITYYEAQAFCKYLSDIDDEYDFDIPSKDQWDLVARAGEENRTFPWGNNWNKNYCNNSSNQLHRTSEIGMFSQGDSKYGISDLVGNVWSWTSSLEKDEYNYLKGGSWNFADPSFFKVSDNQMTFFNNPSFQCYDIGFFCIRTKK